MKPGDILAFSGAGIVSAAINLLTFGSPYSISHVGVVAEHSGRLKLFEAVEQGVVAVPIERRIQRYLGRVYHYPLYRKLYRFERERLSQFLNDDAVGKPYDLRGAIKAGGWLLALSKNHKARTDPSAYYCSELVAHALCVCGIFATGNPSRFSPNSLIRSMRHNGLLQSGGRIK